MIHVRTKGKRSHVGDVIIVVRVRKEKKIYMYIKNDKILFSFDR